MSGRWQHNIPQSLQRGFRAPGGSNMSSNVWFFERGCEPAFRLVKDIAAENDFYSEPSVDGATTLDDQITNYERNSFDRAYQDLKNTAPDSILDPTKAAEVVTHLSIRCDYVRRTFGEAAQKTFLDARTIFCDEKHVRPLLGVDDETPSPKLTEAIDELVAQHGGFGNIPVPSSVIYRVAHMALRERFNSTFLEIAPQLTKLLINISEEAPTFVREGHNKILSSEPAPRPRVDHLSELDWTTRTSNLEGFILPDCVALSCDSDNGLQPILLTTLAEVSLVLMPLSSTKMLVGLKRGAREPDLNGFNKAAATCSHRFFIGAHSRFAELSSHIGSTSRSFMEEAVGTIINKFKADVTPAPDPAPPLTTPVMSDKPLPSASVPTFTIHFLNCAEQATAETIAANVFYLTNEASQVMQLSRLDGMTFARDYESAVSNFDGGFASASLQTIDEGYAIGVAKNLGVLRDGMNKTHIILRSEIGYALIGDNPANSRQAAQTIFAQLERISSSQAFAERFPEVKIDDPLESFLFYIADEIWRNYFSARAGASIYPEVGGGYCEMLDATLHRAHQNLVKARVEYRSTNDMDALMQMAIPRVSEILNFSATVLGHFAGCATSFVESQASLLTTLQKLGLHDWIILFDSELSSLWSQGTQWKSINEFLSLNRHVERLFWQHGLFPWKTDDGLIRVEVRLVNESEQFLLTA
jgi:hypothetical protein